MIYQKVMTLNEVFGSEISSDGKPRVKFTVENVLIADDDICRKNPYDISCRKDTYRGDALGYLNVLSYGSHKKYCLHFTIDNRKFKNGKGGNTVGMAYVGGVCLSR